MGCTHPFFLMLYPAPPSFAGPDPPLGAGTLPHLHGGGGSGAGPWPGATQLLPPPATATPPCRQAPQKTRRRRVRLPLTPSYFPPPNPIHWIRCPGVVSPRFGGGPRGQSPPLRVLVHYCAAPGPELRASVCRIPVVVGRPSQASHQRSSWHRDPPPTPSWWVFGQHTQLTARGGMLFIAPLRTPPRPSVRPFPPPQIKDELEPERGWRGALRCFSVTAGVCPVPPQCRIGAGGAFLPSPPCPPPFCAAAGEAAGTGAVED